MGQLLPYVTDEVLYKNVEKVLHIVKQATDEAEIKLFKNIIDPFSATFDALRQDIELKDWLEQEKARQIQKTMQNAVGDFHQAILGSVEGWLDLGVGGVIDVVNDERKIIAEIKNKYNTTKGNHLKVPYDDLIHSISSTYQGYTAYYVQVIRQTKKPYDKPFTPSDNETHQRRPLNENVRKIDGRSFYSLVTGHEDALDMLYASLPKVIADILGTQPDAIMNDPLYRELYGRAYPDSK